MHHIFPKAHVIWNQMEHTKNHHFLLQFFSYPWAPLPICVVRCSIQSLGFLYMETTFHPGGLDTIVCRKKLNVNNFNELSSQWLPVRQLLVKDDTRQALDQGLVLNILQVFFKSRRRNSVSKKMLMFLSFLVLLYASGHFKQKENS